MVGGAVTPKPSSVCSLLICVVAELIGLLLVNDLLPSHTLILTHISI